MSHVVQSVQSVTHFLQPCEFT